MKKEKMSTTFKKEESGDYIKVSEAQNSELLNEMMEILRGDIPAQDFIKTIVLSLGYSEKSHMYLKGGRILISNYYETLIDRALETGMDCGITKDMMMAAAGYVRREKAVELLESMWPNDEELQDLRTKKYRDLMDDIKRIKPTYYQTVMMTSWLIRDYTEEEKDHVRKNLHEWYESEGFVFLVSCSVLKQKWFDESLMKQLFSGAELGESADGYTEDQILSFRVVLTEEIFGFEGKYEY